jgi:methionine-rich copper-binding protein CopC
MEWQHHIADVIRATEESFPHRHLISQNVANGSQKNRKAAPRKFHFQFPLRNPPTGRRTKLRIEQSHRSERDWL